jgi:hypothetical protein
MADLPREDDPCKKVYEKKGTAKGTSAEYSWDDAWSKARSSACSSAAVDAEVWVMTISCPKACPYRELEIEVGDPSDPTITRGRDAQGHRIWNGASEVDWSAVVKCVETLPGDRGTVEADGTGVMVGGKRRRPGCGQKVRVNDRSQGEGSSIVTADPQAAAATNEANENALHQAYMDANGAVLKIRCRSSCTKRTVIITTSPPQAGKPQKEDVTMPGTMPGGGKKLIECWLVKSKVEWKARVTCHD